jgi:hypothetical protein
MHKVYAEKYLEAIQQEIFHKLKEAALCRQPLFMETKFNTFILL